jgi:predicted dehydrogenase
MAHITRRQALAGAAAPLLVESKTAFGSQASSAVSFGIIGTGGRGRFVGRLMTKDPQARLAAICDIRPERLDAAQTEIPGADKVKAYKDMKDLLARADIDAVLIATPVYLHPEHFEVAAAANKHIYLEKPAGADVAGVKRLLRAAERLDKSKTVAFGFQQRFSPEYLAAEQMIRTGQLGDMTLMISYWIWGGAAYAPVQGPNSRPDNELDRIRQWVRWKDTCGDFIVEQDCHGVDILNWFALAHPEKAYGDGGRYKRTSGDNSDHVNVSYIYPGGLRGWLLGTQLPPRAYWDVKEQFFGTTGVIEVARSYYSWQEEGKPKAVRVDSKREITMDAVEAFFKSIVDRKPFSMTQDAADSTLTSILGRMAVELRREVSWEEMMREA